MHNAIKSATLTLFAMEISCFRCGTLHKTNGCLKHRQLNAVVIRGFFKPFSTKKCAKYFTGKLRGAFAQQKIITFFGKKCQYLYNTFENLMSRQLTTMLGLNDRALEFY